MKSSRKEDGGGECNSLAFRGASRSASATTAEISRLASCRLRFNRERGRKGKDSSSFFVLLSPRFPRGFSGVATMSCIAHGVSPIDQQRACRNTCLRKVYATRATRTETDLVPRPAATPPLLHRFSSEREREVDVWRPLGRYPTLRYVSVGYSIECSSWEICELIATSAEKDAYQDGY